MSKVYNLEQEIQRLTAEHAACDNFVTTRRETEQQLVDLKAKLFDETKKLTARDIYNIVCSGDPIANVEIEFGIRHFREMNLLLRTSGPVFQLAANEAGRIYDRLEGYQKARRER